MEKNNIAEILARNDVYETDIESAQRAFHSGANIAMHAVARLRDEAVRLFDQAASYQSGGDGSTAAGLRSAAHAKLADMGAILAEVLR